MLQDKIFNIENWVRGSYLNERSFNEDIMIRSDLVDQWLRSGDFSKEKLSYRLKQDGLNTRTFNNIVSNKENIRLKKNQILPWVKKLKKVFSVQTNFLKDCEGKPLFFNYYLPFLEYAKSILDQKYLELDLKYNIRDYIDCNSLKTTALNHLLEQLSNLSFRTLIQEMHICKLSGDLKGDTPESRYDYYATNILADHEYIISLLHLYPVLARLTVETMDRFLEFHLESIARFIQDRKQIIDIFEGNFEKLIKISVNAGDQHNGGKSVSIFEFESEDKIVYKPRPLAIDSQFKALLEWINKKEFKYEMKAASTLSMGKYGWQEFILNKECKSVAQIERYYYRFGGFVALLYVLNSVDFHLENVIANGEYPVLIDLETLFSNHYDLIQDSPKGHPMNKEFSDSIFASLLLPVKSAEDHQDFDYSAIANTENQKLRSNNEVWTIERLYTDEMKLIKKPAQFKSSNNRLLHDNKAVNTVTYYDTILAGFRNMYKILMEHKVELLSPVGPLFPFSEMHVRHVLRPTKEYGFLLETSLHPDYLQDGLSRTKLFEHLWRHTSLYNKIQRVIPSECYSLLNQDIPRFSFKMKGTDIVDSSGKVYEDFYNTCCWENLSKKIQRLSERDCEKQLRYIRLSFECNFDDSLDTEQENYSNGQIFTGFTFEKSTSDFNKVFLEKAKEIGDFILEHAVWDKVTNEIFWLDLKKNENRVILPLNESLYDGMLGISIFLAYLARETKDQKYSLAVKAAINSVQSTISEQKPETISAYNGLAAIAFGYFHVGALFDNKELIDAAVTLVYEIEPLIESDVELDLIGGVTGVIIICVQLFNELKDEKILHIANKCALHLINSSTDRISSGILLAGMSHGAAGMAWALIELWSVTGNKLYFNYAHLLLDYEKTLFSDKESNWKDLRFSEEGAFCVFWCHGAPGIGLSRALINLHYSNKDIQEDIQISIEKTKKDGFGSSLCVCHGNYGNLEVLLEISRLLGKSELEDETRNFASKLVSNLELNKWKMSFSYNLEAMGLMTGIAGVGYSCLRYRNSDIPSILALKLPCL